MRKQAATIFALVLALALPCAAFASPPPQGTPNATDAPARAGHHARAHRPAKNVTEAHPRNAPIAHHRAPTKNQRTRAQPVAAPSTPAPAAH